MGRGRRGLRGRARPLCFGWVGTNRPAANRGCRQYPSWSTAVGSGAGGQTGVHEAALPDAAVGEQRQRVARRQAGGDLLQRGAVGAADEDADFAGAGGQEVGEVEVADGDVHAVGVGVGVGEDGAEVGGEVGGTVGV